MPTRVQVGVVAVIAEFLEIRVHAVSVIPAGGVIDTLEVENSLWLGVNVKMY